MNECPLTRDRLTFSPSRVQTFAAEEHSATSARSQRDFALVQFVHLVSFCNTDVCTLFSVKHITCISYMICCDFNSETRSTINISQMNKINEKSVLMYVMHTKVISTIFHTILQDQHTVQQRTYDKHENLQQNDQKTKFHTFPSPMLSVLCLDHCRLWSFPQLLLSAPEPGSCRESKINTEKVKYAYNDNSILQFSKRCMC